MTSEGSTSAGRRWGGIAGVTAGAVAGVAVALWIGGTPTTPRARVPRLSPGVARQLMAVRPQITIPASLDLAGSAPDESPMLGEGAAVGLSFRIERRARALVLEDRANLQLLQLYPIPGQPATPIRAGRRIEVTDPAGEPLVIVEPAGSRRVRLLVFPEDVDPFSLQPTELLRVLSHLTIIERTYEAGPRAACPR